MPFSFSKSKDPASTLSPLKNGASIASTGQNPSQPTGTGAGQLSVAPGPVTSGPSPHVIRRGTFSLLTILYTIFITNRWHLESHG